MKYVDEFRDPDAAKALLTRIHNDAEKLGRSISLMEVCGGHTHTIYRYGLENLLPSSIELVHGPGCPVCVLPMGRVDDALWLAQQPNVILTCFGDMMRVPGSTESLMQARARVPTSDSSTRRLMPSSSPKKTPPRKSSSLASASKPLPPPPQRRWRLPA